MKRVLSLLCVGLPLVALGSCGAPEAPADPARVTQPIINGTNSTDGQFPTVVGLLVDAYAIDQQGGVPFKCKRGSGACTGTMIREDVILTAAHCVTNLLKNQQGVDCPNDVDPPKYTFKVDLIAEARAGQVVATRKVVTHPMFAPQGCVEPPGPQQWNDIALVFLKDPVKGAKLQRLPTPQDAATLVREGVKTRIVGYGKSITDQDTTAGQQRNGTATLVKAGATEIQVGQANEQQACQGDSGGPVFSNPDGTWDQQVQLGVVSRLRTLRCPSLADLLNPPKCENGALYTRIDPYLDWINKTIADESPQPTPDMAGGADMSDGPGTPKGGCSCQVDGAGAAGGATPGLVLAALAWLGARRRRQG